MSNIPTYLYELAQHPYLFFIIICLSLSIKIYYLVKFLPHISHAQQSFTIRPLFLLLISLLGAILIDTSWLVKLFHSIFTPTAPYHIVAFVIRIAWAFLLIQYEALELFLQSLTVKQFHLNLINKITITLSALISGYFFYIAFFQYHTLATIAERDIQRATITSLEFFIMKTFVIYFLAFIMIKGLLLSYYNAQTITYPKILQRQLRLFILYLICPYLLIQFLLGVSFQIIYEMYLVVSISTLMLCYAIYYCFHNVIKLRFMNITPHVQAPPKPHVIEDFKQVLDQLSKTSSLQELVHITQTFFKYAFQLPINTITLTIRDHQATNPLSSKGYFIEQFLSQYADYTKENHSTQNNVFMYHEITFDNFYHENRTNSLIIQFLEKINADVFIPIACHKKIVAHIVIDQEARAQLFSQAERDAMAVFACHLGNIINLLQHKNINILLQKEKQLKDNIYLQHQEIHLYKESITKFLRHSKEKTVGIIFYKHGTFTHGNQDAKTIVPINLNLQAGHPLTKACKIVAQHVDTYKAPHTQLAKDIHGRQIVISGVCNQEKQNIILMITYPDISDIIARQKHLLDNPNDWDYLLYLNTTKTGISIHQLFPGTTELLLNFKIKLLQAALSRNALMLDLAHDDLLPTVRLLHTIGSRETLHTIELNEPITSFKLSEQLFGTYTLHAEEQELMKQLNNGTIFIKNIHFLDLTTQKHLTEYITHGFYHVSETDKKVSGTARIICSTNQNLSHLVQEGLFSHELLTHLKPATVQLPSLITMPKQELYAIINAYTDSFITSHIAKNLYSLTDTEKMKLIEQHSSSVHELKKNIELIVFKKSNEQTFYGSTTTHETDDPLLIEAAGLGKQALKNPRIMALLWKKLKTQNKIALFLGVNRSSVNRRLNALGLRTEQKNKPHNPTEEAL